MKVKWTDVINEFRAYLLLRKSYKYIRKAKKLIHEDRKRADAYRFLSLEYEKRAKEISGKIQMSISKR